DCPIFTWDTRWSSMQRVCGQSVRRSSFKTALPGSPIWTLLHSRATQPECRREPSVIASFADCDRGILQMGREICVRNSSRVIWAAALLAVAAAFGQQDRGAISGTVLDATGAVVPNARVVVTN